MGIDVAIQSDYKIMKKEQEKLQKYQGLREQLEGMWRMRTLLIPVVIGALEAVNVAPTGPRNNIWDLRPEECSATVGTAKILRRPLTLIASGRGP